MCGIIGYIGSKPVLGVLVDGLSRMEYRGYDSAGVAFFKNGVLETVKAKGRLQNLKDKLEGCDDSNSHIGIGHTRWATHGEPSDINSHPHSSELITVVHNGIIENYSELKKILLAEGYTFKSDKLHDAVFNLRC